MINNNNQEAFIETFKNNLKKNLKKMCYNKYIMIAR